MQGPFQRVRRLVHDLERDFVNPKRLVNLGGNL